MSGLSYRVVSRLLGAGLACSLSLAACKRSAPSPEFERAHAEFTRLYGEHLDEAYTRPEMDTVLQTLEQVPDDSADAQAARALRERIEKGREEARQTEEARAAASARATAPVVPAPSASADAAAPPEATNPQGAADAGFTQPTPGMDLRAFQTQFSGCFSPGVDVVVQGQGLRGTWQLKNIANCRDRHPGYDSKLLIVGDGKVLGLIDKSQAKLTVIDGGTGK